MSLATVQGTPTEGFLYPCVVTIIVEHSTSYWACMVQVVGNHLGGYSHKVPKEALEKVQALEVGTPLVLVKKHGRIRLQKAPAGSEPILLPGATHLTQGPYPIKIKALFPKLNLCQS